MPPVRVTMVCARNPGNGRPVPLCWNLGPLITVTRHRTCRTESPSGGSADVWYPSPLLHPVMEDDDQLGRRLCFGVFELDLRTAELRKRGLRVRLQEQPFQVLAMLLERAGQVVGREELQKKLWRADTFVDFDHGLNKAINKIREA